MSMHSLKLVSVPDRMIWWGKNFEFWDVALRYRLPVKRGVLGLGLILTLLDPVETWVNSRLKLYGGKGRKREMQT